MSKGPESEDVESVGNFHLCASVFGSAFGGYLATSSVPSNQGAPSQLGGDIPPDQPGRAKS